MKEQYIDKPSLKQIRINLWKIAEAKGTTLEDIQILTGFSYSQVYRIVRGEQNISVSGLLRVCAALQVQIADVVTFDIKPLKPLEKRKPKKLPKST